VSVLYAYRVHRSSSGGRQEPCFTHAEKGELHRAIRDYGEAIRISTYPTIYLLNRGLIHTETGQYDLAIEDYAAAIGLNQIWAWPFRERGVAYAAKG
jgi:tetratricopeptide (TPR) repeat protein